jgi:hypothetical protein
LPGGRRREHGQDIPDHRLTIIRLNCAEYA